MLVFVLKARGIKCGGVAVVAAPTTMRAKELASGLRQTHSSAWLVEYDEPFEINILPMEHDVEGVLSHHEYGEP